MLGWEHFLRVLDQGDEEAAKALFGPSSSKNVKLLRTGEIGRFITMLFFLSPPLLLFVGLLFAKHKDLFDWHSIPWLRGAILVLALMAWVYALSRYWRFVRMRTDIDQALLQAPQRYTTEGQSNTPGPS